MQVFELSRHFPVDERYSMTDQIRKSSRSVCSNLAEGWRKRGYKKVFVNKLSDAMQEANETQTWLEFALACQYIDRATYEVLFADYENVLGKLNVMEMKADSFCF